MTDNEIKAILGEEATAEQITAFKQAVAKNYVAKADFNAKLERIKELEAAKTQPPQQKDDWETKYNTLLAETEKQVTESKEKLNRYRLNSELKALGAKNTKAVLGLIDVSKLDFDAEDKIGGLDDLIKECKKSDAYLFDAPAGDVKPGSGMDTTNDQKKAEPKVIPQVI